MERTEDHIEDALIDLGAVSEETKGFDPDQPEIGVGVLGTGLSDA